MQKPRRTRCQGPKLSASALKQYGHLLPALAVVLVTVSTEVAEQEHQLTSVILGLPGVEGIELAAAVRPAPREQVAAQRIERILPQELFGIAGLSNEARLPAASHEPALERLAHPELVGPERHQSPAAIREHTNARFEPAAHQPGQREDRLAAGELLHELGEIHLVALDAPAEQRAKAAPELGPADERGCGRHSQRMTGIRLVPWGALDRRGWLARLRRPGCRPIAPDTSKPSRWYLPPLRESLCR